ncbi:MAG TPA: Rpp14/Pop5 family protein [Candidatus Acidoferrales bacterium]|nr:Rpp14/Pop5 family protein [Candidatus Acidoferrales bacterium]
MATRYLLVKIICDRKLTNEQFHEALTNAAIRYFGELGTSRINPRIMKFDEASSTAIISCDRDATAELQSALALVTDYAETPLSMLVLRVSGTVKGATKHRK